MPKYWCTRGSFFTPPSKSTKSCISSISRSFSHILSRYLSSLKRLLSASSSFHLRKYFSGVPMAPYCRPSESLPAKMNCTVLKNQALNSGCWFERLLPDAVADGDAAVLQLQHADGDAVHVEHEVRPPLVVALERHLLGDGEVVLLRLVPVDEVDGLRDLARLDLHRHAVAQQVVDGLVVAVERAAVVVRLGAQLVQARR